MNDVLAGMAPTPTGAIFFLVSTVVAFLMLFGVVVFALVQAVRKRGNVRLFCLMILASFALMAASIALAVGHHNRGDTSAFVARPYLEGGTMVFIIGIHLVSVVGATARKRWSPPLFAFYIVANFGLEFISYAPAVSVTQDIVNSLKLTIDGAALAFLFFVVTGKPETERAAIPEVF